MPNEIYMYIHVQVKRNFYIQCNYPIIISNKIYQFSFFSGTYNFLYNIWDQEKIGCTCSHLINVLVPVPFILIRRNSFDGSTVPTKN